MAVKRNDEQQTERKDTHLRVGFLGERRAAKFLKKAGYTIIERNFKCPFGEVDIIARKDDVVAFIEVKARTSDAYGAPRQAVDLRRQKRYLNCAKFYFSGHEVDYTVRFDVIEVLKREINHIENAFS
jgi:putative endonuclease